MNGWPNKCPITIPSSAVPADTTDVPLLFIASNLPSELLAASGGCNEDGSDIRFTSDASGTIELPRDISAIDKTGGTIAVYVKVPSVSTSADTTIYLFWGNSNAVEPGKGSPSEYRLVWGEYYGVYHLENSVADWKGIDDAAGRWSNMTPNGTIAEIAGFASGTTGYHLSSTFGMDFHEYLDLASVTLQLSFWFRFTASPTGTIATGTNGIPLEWAAGAFGPGWGGGKSNGAAFKANQWQHMVLESNAGVLKFYVDGVNQTSGSGSISAVQFKTFGNKTTLGMDVAEIRRTRNILRDINYYKVIYANGYNVATFSSSGTVETVSESYTMTITGVVDGSEIRIYSASDNTELAGIENSSGDFTWNFSHSGDFDIHIVIHSLMYEYIKFTDFTVTAGNITIPISQRKDRNYTNP